MRRCWPSSSGNRLPCPPAAQAVVASLLAFVVVYFAVFGAGVLYILKLMAKAPTQHEAPLPNTLERAAGTTPAAALKPSALATD